jgi:hypothetical protein
VNGEYGYGRNLYWRSLRHYPGISLKELRKPTGTLSLGQQVSIPRIDLGTCRTRSRSSARWLGARNSMCPKSNNSSDTDKDWVRTQHDKELRNWTDHNPRNRVVKGVDWIYLAPNRHQWLALVNTVINFGFHKRQGLTT